MTTFDQIETLTTEYTEVGDVRLVVCEDLIRSIVQTFVEVEPVG